MWRSESFLFLKILFLISYIIKAIAKIVIALWSSILVGYASFVNFCSTTFLVKKLIYLVKLNNT